MTKNRQMLTGFGFSPVSTNRKLISEIVDDVYLANAYAKNMYTILRYGFF